MKHEGSGHSLISLAQEVAGGYASALDLSGERPDITSSGLYDEKNESGHVLEGLNVGARPSSYYDGEKPGTVVSFSYEPLADEDYGYASILVNRDGSTEYIEGDSSSTEPLHERIDGFYDVAKEAVVRAMRQARDRALERGSVYSALKPLRYNGANVEKISDSPIDVIEKLPDSLCSDLAEAGIGIGHRISVREGDADYYVSAPFYDTGAHRPHVVILHEEEGVTVPRVYYRSGSQAVWRWLPAKVNSWYSKGSGEQTLDVPIAVQKALDTLYADSGSSAAVTSGDGTSSVGRVVRAIVPHVSGVSGELSVKQMPECEYFSEVDVSKEVNGTDVYAPVYPNFTQKVDTWRANSEVYGEVWHDVFLSNDGTIRYQMSHNANGMAWLAHVEPTNLELRPTLNSNSIILTGREAATPAYEYGSNKSPSGGSFFGVGEPHPQFDEYVDVFTSFLSSNSLIDRYYRTIPDDHFPWKTRFKDIPNWPGLRAMIDGALAEGDQSLLELYQVEVEHAISAAAGKLSERETITATVKDVLRFLDEIVCGLSLDNTPTMDSTLVEHPYELTGGIFSVVPFDNPAVVAKLTLLRELGFAETHREIEKYNPDLTRAYYVSERFPDTYVYEFTPDGVMGIGPQL